MREGTHGGVLHRAFDEDAKRETFTAMSVKPDFLETMIMGFCVLVLIGALVSLRTATARAADKPTAQRITLADNSVCLTLGNKNDGFAIRSLFCSVRQREFIADALHPLWTLFVEKDGQESLEWTSISEVFKREAQYTRTRAKLIWRGTGDARGLVVLVSAVVADSRVTLKMSVENRSRKLSLMRVRFPSMALCQIGESAEDDAFLRPEISGILAKAPLVKGLQSDAHYPGGWGPLQFVAHYDQDAGLYLGTHDPLACFKRFFSRKTDSGIEVSVEWPAESASVAGNDFKHPGEIVLSTFGGDWFDASQIYRQWVSAKAKWWPQRRKYGRPDIPDWLKDICFWIRIRGVSDQLVEDAKRVAEFMGVPTALHWYDWHVIPYDTDYPHYFPAKEGFAEGIAELQEAGIRVMPYINGRLWDSEAPDFEQSGRAVATKDRKAECYVEIYKSGRKLVPVCPTQPLWQKIVKNATLRLFSPEFNVDGVYIDQIAAANPKECYDATHGHPLCGGHWWNTEGYWPLLRSLRRSMSRYPDRFLTSECNADPYAHLFDAYLTWHFQYNDMVPAFAAVYADKILTFGRAYGGTEPLAHRMRAAQSLVFGEQIGWITTDVLDSQPDTAIYIRKCARIRYRLLDYLARGVMLRPPTVHGEIPDVTADWAWFGKLDVTNSALQRGAWKAEEGSVAFVFANSSDEPISFTWDFSPEQYGLPNRALSVRKITEEGKSEEPNIQGQTSLKMHLEPRGIESYLVRAKKSVSRK